MELSHFQRPVRPTYLWSEVAYHMHHGLFQYPGVMKDVCPLQYMLHQDQAWQHTILISHFRGMDSSKCEFQFKSRQLCFDKTFLFRFWFWTLHCIEYVFVFRTRTRSWYFPIQQGLHGTEWGMSRIYKILSWRSWVAISRLAQDISKLVSFSN